MTVQKVVDEMVDKELEVFMLQSGGKTPLKVIDELKAFFRSYTKKIIEAVGEEVIGDRGWCPSCDNNPEIFGGSDNCLYKRRELQDEQRTRLATIVKSLGEKK